MVNLKWVNVDSSNLRKVAYDSSNSDLYVEFIKSGVYVYHNVSQEIYTALLNAESKGRFLIYNVKPYYSFSKK